MANPYPAEFTDDGGVERLAGSVTFTDPANQPGGGSQPGVIIPLAFNTAGLVLTGKTIWTPSVDVMLIQQSGGMLVDTIWNGTTPLMHIGVPGNLSGLEGYWNVVDLTDAAAVVVPGVTSFGAFTGGQPNPGIVIAAGTAITAMVDDGSGGDPGSTAGAGRLILPVVAI